jgi:hypothetical protein
VGPVVVHDDMHLQFSGYLGLDLIQELAKFQRAMQAVQLSDYPAGLQLQRSKQRCCAMAFVVVGTALRFPGRKGINGWVRSST